MSGGGKKGGGIPDIPTESTSLADPIYYYFERARRYPNNAEIWWAYRRPLEIGSDSPPKTYLEVFDPSLRHQITLGNSPAPKGHYILKAFRQDRSGVTGLGGNIPVVDAGARRPSAVAFYAGRVFYAGVNTTNFNTKVYFSQIIERAGQVQACYQALDPTNEDVRDLLPSDGGVIVIPEISEIYHMVPYGPYLFVFARNGVWMISGSEGIGFRANDYSVTKLSGTPAISNLSFVLVEGVPIWWNRSGIYTIAMDGNQPQVASLTEDTIKSYYDTIPEQSKFYAKGAYDPLTKKVQWLFRSTEAETTPEVFNYDRILVLDTNTRAFYPYSQGGTPRIYMKGIFNTEGFSTEQVNESIYVGEDQVLVSTDGVIVTITNKVPVQAKIKYVVNVKSDTVGILTTPDSLVLEDEQVYVSDDEVLVNSDTVFIPQ